MRIVYATQAAFPDDSAGSNRMRGVIAALESAGIEVVVAGAQAAGPSGAGGATTATEVVGVGDQAQQRLRALRGVHALVAGSGLVDWLEREAGDIDAVLMYQGGMSYTARLQRWSRAHGIPVAIDSVEWFDTSHVALGRWGPFAADSEVSMRWGYPAVGNVMAISQFLADHFEGAGANVVRVPPILEVSEMSPRLDLAREDHAGDVRTLVYAGSPGRKDLLPLVVQAVGEHDPQGRRLRLRVAGPSVEEVRTIMRGAGIGADCPAIVPLGRITPDDVRREVRDADFTVLVRQPERYAIAGFSSKVPESLALGTPVIATVTTELARYLRHGLEAVVLASASVSAMKESLAQIDSLTDVEMAAMRVRAREQAVRSFEASTYGPQLADWFSSLEVRAGWPSRARSGSR